MTRKLIRTCDANGWHHQDEDGKPAYSERYAMVGDFHNGLAQASDREPSKGYAFHIGEDGKPAYDERYDHVTEFRGKFAFAINGDRAFLIGRKGKRLGDLLVENDFSSEIVFDNPGIKIKKITK